jgi:hypothetical protein
MTTESNDIAFLSNNDALDPVSFFKWKNYASQGDKMNAHSAYQSLIRKAELTDEWRKQADLMRQLWSYSKDDNTLRDFWSSLPKNSTTQKIQRIQVTLVFHSGIFLTFLFVKLTVLFFCNHRTKFGQKHQTAEQQ